MYEPYYDEQLKELEVCLNFYKKLTKKVRRWDGMEIENWLSCRDGIKDSIKKLRKNGVNVSSYLKKVKNMDEKLIKEIEYVQKATDGYTASDDYDISHWWWYLDDIVAGKVKIVFNKETGMYEGIDKLDFRSLEDFGSLSLNNSFFPCTFHRNLDVVLASRSSSRRCKRLALSTGSLSTMRTGLLRKHS